MGTPTGTCPFCGQTGDCPHWEERYNCWSRDGKGSFEKHLREMIANTRPVQPDCTPILIANNVTSGS